MLSRSKCRYRHNNNRVVGKRLLYVDAHNKHAPGLRMGVLHGERVENSNDFHNLARAREV